VNEHGPNQPEEIDDPEEERAKQGFSPEQINEYIYGGEENGPAIGEAAAAEAQAEVSPDSRPQLDSEAIRGFGATVRALRNAAADTRRITTERADKIAPRKLRWLWPDRIPLGKVTVFAGLPGQGKSLATVDIGARLTTAREYPDCPNPLPASEVLFVAGEDDPEDALIPRLMAAGADRSRIHWLKGVRDNGKDDSLRLDMDIAGIKQFLDDHRDIRLVVLDPISNHLGGASMVDEQEVRSILVPLAEISKDCDLAIICVMHLNKKEGLAPIHRVSGAAAFIGVARASWLFAPDPETQSNHLMMPLKNNYAKQPSSLVYRVDEGQVSIENEDVPIPRMKWLDEIDVDLNAVVLGAPTRRSNAKAFLEKILAKGPCDSSAVYDAAMKEGISKRTLERAKAELEIKSQKNGEAWEWQLPDSYWQGKVAKGG
jgi:hypothetical protein